MVTTSKNIKPIMFIPAYKFISTLIKEDICEFIDIIMNKVGAQTFGYQILNDEYWGKIKINRNKNVQFTLSFQKTEYTNSTVVIVSVLNATITEGEKLSSKIYETIKLFENTPSLYNKKYKA